MAAGAILLYIGANQCSVLNTVYFSYSVDQESAYVQYGIISCAYPQVHIALMTDNLGGSGLPTYFHP